METGFKATVFSVNCFVAGMLALFIAFSLNLESPSWALTTVYITSTPLSGAVRAKARFRIFGTILGAAAMLAIVPNLVPSPN